MSEPAYAFARRWRSRRRDGGGRRRGALRGAISGRSRGVGRDGAADHGREIISRFAEAISFAQLDSNAVRAQAREESEAAAAAAAAEKEEARVLASQAEARARMLSEREAQPSQTSRRGASPASVGGCSCSSAHSRHGPSNAWNMLRQRAALGSSAQRVWTC
jgi:hypothetical protein